jgi:hypothetical protein
MNKEVNQLPQSSRCGLDPKPGLDIRHSYLKIKSASGVAGDNCHGFRHPPQVSPRPTFAALPLALLAGRTDCALAEEIRNPAKERLPRLPGDLRQARVTTQAVHRSAFREEEPGYYNLF